RHLATPVNTGIWSRIVYQYLPHLVITIGDFIRDRLVNFNRFPGEKIISVPTGVDQEVFYPRPLNHDLRKTLGIADDEKAIAAIAALRSWKGHDHLLEAAKLLIGRRRGIRFIIAGDGPRYDHLKEKAASLGISDKVIFLGYRDDVNDILSAIDIAVLPSYANEGVPQAILQAMAMEKPVVSTTAGSIPEIVRDRETGVLTEPKNPASLAEGIELMLDNEDLAKTVALNARKLIDSKYSLKHMVLKMEEAYNLIFQRKHGEMNNG
ncbi:MAG TPA: glycosyltransferase family 1 protein, partial [Nitrospirae bacterium]|nr:glycosyltransferase family 1 protein [Nitrospirota bacterium]